MAGARPTWVVVGASLAGGRAVETLRGDGFEGRIVLIGADPERPYERPPLSKELLRGMVDEERVFLRPPEWYAENDIELRAGTTAHALDAASRQVVLEDAERLAYDRLLVTTGAFARHVGVPGEELDGVFTLRTLADCHELRRRLAARPRVALVGAGFIGGEVAASCREMGLDVVAIEMMPVPLEPLLGRRVGGIYKEIHRAHGVELLTGQRVTAFAGADRVEEVVTDRGARIACDLAVVGVGAVPACEWLLSSGLEIRDGVLVDELCRTSLPDVFAAGDVASSWNPRLGRRIRVEHYHNAQNQGVAAAKSMLESVEPYAPVPTFWSDQYDLHLQHVGMPGPDDAVVLRGNPQDGAWCAFYRRDGRLAAALCVNKFREYSAARRLIEADAAVASAELADPSVDLRELARRLAPAERKREARR